MVKWFFLVLIFLFGAASAQAQERFITVASTTSTANTGLFDSILPMFTATSGIAVRVVAVGTGAALKLGERGDVDMVLVHARAAEDRFVTAGFGVARRDVMYNDFVIVGPLSDPAAIAGMRSAPGALSRIAASRARFVSRGDDSGTHKAELRLWDAAGGAPRSGDAEWYREAGAGMGATLNTARAMDAYTLVDRGTWLSFANRGDLVALVEGDPRLFNPYGVILVNPTRHPHVKATDSMLFIDWLTGSEGQAAIGAFTINGERLFTPSAK
ncbi:MAG: substrate-binding domain-containing protein [Proteobacteria bacterium]|nr:substrate-binding domain-containing protein [Pseudomonadota bacterium]